MATLQSKDGVKWTIDTVPDECPICHRAIDARFLLGVSVKTPQGTTGAEFVFQCPHKSCEHVFIGRYVGEHDHTIAGVRFRLRSTTPYVAVAPVHPPAVEKLSPQFVEVYRQAAAGEAWGLGEIAGCGYRKALEFLLKDYTISLHPTKAKAIKSKLLMAVIGEYIDDANIKASAARATWLGNDETHYERRWTDKDIKDLKALIALTESWVNTHLLTQQYLNEMPDPKAKSQS